MSFRERITEKPQNLPPCRPGHRSWPLTRAISGNSAIAAPVSSACRSRIADEEQRRHRRPGEWRRYHLRGNGDGSCAPEGMKHGSGSPRCHATVGRPGRRREHQRRDHADWDVPRRLDAETAMRRRSGYRRPARHGRGSESWWRCRRGPLSWERPLASPIGHF
jgi:hypothetical protein